MNEKELLEKIQGLISDSTKGVITEKELEAKVAAINKQLEALNNKEDNHAEVKSLKDAVDKLIAATADNAAAIKAMTEQSKKESRSRKANTPKEILSEGIVDGIVAASKGIPNLVTTVKDQYGERLSIKDYFEKYGNRQTPEIKIDKVAVDMLQSNIVQANISTIRLTELDPQRVGIPLNPYPHVFEFMSSKTITRPNMALAVVYSYEDGAGTKTEGSASSKSSFLFKTVSFPSFYIGTHFVLSDETMDDLPETAEEIAATGPDKILDSIDGKILSTAGDDSSDIAGLYTANKMTAFASATTYANKYPNANEYSVLAGIKLQRETNKYKPDVAVMNPLDISILIDKKDQIDNSLQDRRLVFDSLGNLVAFNGLRIINSSAQTANTVSVFDSRQVWIGKRKDMVIQYGYNGTDLTEGQMTAVLKTRLAFGVRDKAAVIYCSDFAAAVAAITV